MCSMSLLGLTWGGDTVVIFRDIVIQSLKQRPHGETEHSSQEAIEDQIKEEDEA